MGKFSDAVDSTRPEAYFNRRMRDLERQVREQAAAKRTRFADIGDDYTMTPEGPRPVAPMPLPDGIAITAGTEEVAFVWSGSASSQIPTDFGRLAIHASKFSGYTPTQGTEVATISSPYGGTTNYSADGGDTYYIRCAIASLRGDYGPFTDEVAVTPKLGADGETFRGDVVGRSIAIATTTAGSYPETFSGSSLPSGWTHNQYVSSLAGVPGGSVVSTGVPSGSDNGSALLVDLGPAMAADTGTAKYAWGYVSTGISTVDAEIRTRFRYEGADDPAFTEVASVYLRMTGSFGYSDESGIFINFVGASPPRVVSRVNGTDTTLGQLWDVALARGTWYNLHVRAVAGRLEVTFWADGSTEPDPSLFALTSNLAAGTVGVSYRVTNSYTATAGTDIYFDTFDVDALATGFTVNPDGTARMSAAEIGVLTITGGDTWHTVGDPGEPAYVNGWAASTNPVQLTKDAANNVHLRGTANVGTSGTVAFTLPAAYRPSAAVTIPASDNAGAFGRLIVRTNGDVEGYYSGAPARLNFNAVYLVRA